jgi:hypothetical protein
MFCHEREAALPLLNIEVLLTKPTIAVIIAATPKRLAYMVVEVDNNALIR